MSSKLNKTKKKGESKEGKEKKEKKDKKEKKEKGNESNVDGKAESAKKGGMMLRAKKKMASRAAPSLFNKFADKETLHVVELMEAILGRVTTPAEAAKIKKYIIIIVAKTIVLHQNKMLSDEQWGSISQLFRRIAVLFRNLFWSQSHANATKAVETGDTSGANELQLTNEAMERVSTLSKDIDKRLTSLLNPHLQKKTQGKLKEVTMGLYTCTCCTSACKC